MQQLTLNSSNSLFQRHSPIEHPLDVNDSQKYTMLLNDIYDLQEVIHGLHDLVQEQQSDINTIEDNIEHVNVIVNDAEHELKLGESSQSLTRNVKIVIIVITGSLLAATGWGTALLIGVKPILGIVFGSGVGIILGRNII